MNENRFINELRSGNETAFKELVENYRQMVINTCFGILHNIDDAEDVAQEVFIQAFRSAERFRGDSKISTWLYRIAVNISLNFIRNNKRKRWLRLFDDEAEVEKLIAPAFVSPESDSPDYNLENSQRAAILHHAVDSLAENQKVAFVLSKYEDLTNKEIAEIMKLSVSSVESLLFRAKSNLQKKLMKIYSKNIF